MKRRVSAFNALLAIDKPAGLTSHDVVAKVRRVLGERRVGHAGTLDPLATGVLVVGVGQATRLMGMLTLDRKSYRATFSLGAETTTDDAEGEVRAQAEVDPQLLDEAYVRTIVEGLQGEHQQVPPTYSSVSVGGVRAHAAARAGNELELAPRAITIYRAHLVRVDVPTTSWVVDFEVSKGTYIRSIARDLGRDLGCYAHVSDLRRTRSGPISLRDCMTLDELSEGGIELARSRCLDPVAALGLGVRRLSPQEVVAVGNGRPLDLGTTEKNFAHHTLAQGEHVALTTDAGLVGVWERRGRRLACVANFPQAIAGIAPELCEANPDCPLTFAGLARWTALAIGGITSCSEGIDGLAGWKVVQPFEACDGKVTGKRWARTNQHHIDEQPLVLAIGAFDGVHRGHQALIERARQEADKRGARLGVLTFSPDPSQVVGPASSCEDELLTISERLVTLAHMNIDELICLDFTQELAHLTHEVFISQALTKLGNLAALVVGCDFRMGEHGCADVSALAQASAPLGIDVLGIDLADEGGTPISASRIRSLVRAGKVGQAALLLGRAHMVWGTVVEGRKLGRTLGFPTANIRVSTLRCLPAEGVYAGFVVVSDTNNRRQAWPAAINVGRPRTLDPGQEGDAFVEATLVGFSGDLYGKQLGVAFTHWLRAPREFSSLSELERVVTANVAWVEQTFGTTPVYVGEEAL